MAMFDTLKFARHLESSGLTPQVAGGVAEALADALMGSNLATKDDLLATKNELRAEITGLRHDVELLRRDLTIKLGGMMVVATGVLLAAIRYLPPHP
jgi:hypothetical protein